MERKKLGKCQVALISQDAQGPMLSVRFACVSNRGVRPQRGQLELHQGLLGLFHGQICGARRIARTTLRVAKTMFQARRKPPSGWCGKAPTFYKKAWQHFRRRVEPRRQSFACSTFQNKMLLPDADAAEEMFASDAAADELRAGRLLSLRDHFPAETFPAMKIRLRDSAHAVQRQLSAVLTCCIPSKQPCAERTTNRQLPCWLRFAKKWHLDKTLQEYKTQRCLLRLPQMFDANSKQLYEQFQDLKPTAQRHRPVLSLFNGAYCLSCFACRFPMLCPGKQLSKSEELGDLQAWTLAESSVSGRCPDMSKTLARVLLASAAGTAQSERDFADIKYHTARDRAFLGPYFKAFERRLRQ